MREVPHSLILSPGMWQGGQGNSCGRGGGQRGLTCLGDAAQQRGWDCRSEDPKGPQQLGV